MATTTDARRELRYSWARKTGDEVLLRTAEQGNVLVVSLFDVSANGAGLAVRQPLPVGQEVSIVVRTSGVKIEFLANVAWCRLLSDEEMARSAPQAVGALHGVGVHIRGSGSFLTMLKALPMA